VVRVRVRDTSSSNHAALIVTIVMSEESKVSFRGYRLGLEVRGYHF
jgi:hypothetical protein